MKIFGINEIKSDIYSKMPKCAYVIFGNDGYLKKIYSDKLIDISYSGDVTFNLQRFSYEAAFGEVYDAIWQYPLMADTKCVVLTDFDVAKCSNEDFDLLCSVLKEPCESTVFILLFNRIEIDRKASRFKKMLDAVEKGGRAVCIDHMTRSELAKTLCVWAKKRGCVLNINIANYMIECCGDDTSTLKSELEKLCAFTKCGEITRQNIDEICIKTVESSVYNLSRAITSAKISDAMRILDELFFLKVEPMVILYTLSSAYTDIFRVLSAINSNKNNRDVIDDFGYKGREFVVTKAQDSLRRLDENKLCLSFEALMNADSSLKVTGACAREILESLIVELCFIVTNGRAPVERKN